MSEVIASKVVELKFNNAEFERNVKTSLSTIEKLKKSLNFDTVTTSVGLLQNALQLKGLKNISSQLGQVVGAVDKTVSPIMSTISSIGNAITSNIGGAISGVVNQIKTGGFNRAMNIEQAKFSLQGLGIEWQTIEKSISNAVNDTAYGLDAAAKVAATMSASGISLDVIGKDIINTSEDLTEMEMVLKSISGVAAQTNSEFDEIGHIFSTVAAQGSVMGMELSQLSSRGMNAAADLGDALGKTESEILDMASKREISAQTFFEVMYEKYWPNSAKANETLNGVVANIKSAYGRIGAAFIQPLTENKGPVVNFLNTYKAAIGQVASKLQPLNKIDPETGKNIEGKLVRYATDLAIDYITRLQTAIENFNVLRLWRSIYRFLKGGIKLFESFVDILEVTGSAFKEVFPEDILNVILNVAKQWTKFTYGISKFTKSAKNMKPIRKILVDIFTDLKDIFGYVIDNVKNFAGGFTKAFKKWDLNPLQIFADIIGYINDNLDKSIVPMSTFESIIDSIGTIIGNVVGILEAFGQAVVETFNEGHFHPIEYLKDLLETLTNGIVNDDRKVGQLKNTFKIFTTAIGILAKVLGFVLLVFAQLVNWGIRLGGVVLNITSPIGTLVSKIFELATGFGEAIKNIDLNKYDNLKKAVDGLKDIFGKAKDAVKKCSDAIVDFVDNAIGKLNVNWGDVFDTLLTTLDNIIGKIDKIKNWFTKGIGKSIDTFKDNVDKAFGKDTQTNMEDTETILERISKIDLMGKFGNGLKLLGDTFKDLVDIVKNSPLFSALGKDIKSFMDDMGSAFSADLNMENGSKAIDNTVDLFEKLGDGIGKIIDAIGKIVKGFTDSVLSYTSSDELKKTMEVVFDFLTTVTVFDWAVTLRNISNTIATSSRATASEKFYKVFNTVASVFKAMGDAMLKIAAAIYILSTIDQDKLKSSALVLGIFMAIILFVATIFTKTSKTLAGWGFGANGTDKMFHKWQYEIDKFSFAVLAMGLSLIMMAVAFKILDKVDPKEMAAHMVVLMSALFVMVVLAKWMNKNVSAVDIKTQLFFNYGKLLKAMAVSLIVVAAALYVISLIPSERLDKAVHVLTDIIVVLGIFIAVIMSISKSWSSLSASAMQMPATLASLAGVIIAFALFSIIVAKALVILALIPQKQLNKGTDTLVNLITCIAIMFMALTVVNSVLPGSATTMFSVAVGIIAVAGACMIFAVAMAAFIPIPWEAIEKGLASIVVGLTALVVLGAIAESTGAMWGILAIAGAIGILALAFSLFTGALIAIIKAGPAAIVACGALFFGLGKAIGKFFEGIAEGTGDILDAIGDTIANIFNYLDEHGDEIITSLNVYTAKIVAGLVNSIGAIGVGIAEGIMASIVGGFDGEELAKELTPELERINKQWDETVKSRDGGFAIANSDYTTAMDQLKELNSIVGLDGTVYKGYEQRAEFLTKQLRDATGVEIDVVNGQIDKYHELYSEISKTIEIKKAEALIDANQEAYMEAIQNKDEITKNLAKAEEDYKDHADKIAEINDMIEVQKAKIEGPNALGKDTVPYYLAEKSLEVLEEKKKKLQDELVSYKETMDESRESFDEMNLAIKGQESLIGAVESGNINDIKYYSHKLEKGYAEAGEVSKEYLEKQYKDYKDYYEKLKKAHEDGVEGITEADVKGAEAWMNKASEALNKAMHTSQAELEYNLKNIKVDYSEEAIKKFSEESMASQAKLAMEKAGLTPEQIEANLGQTMADSGDALGGEFTGAFNNNLENFDADKVVNDTLNSELGSDSVMNNFYNNGYESGEYYSSGWINAVEDNTPNVEDAAKHFAQVPIDTTDEVQKIKSPSRVMMERGKYFVAGFVNGIYNSIGNAESSVKSLAETVISAFDSYDLSSDYQPKITPVVDLSNVNAASSSINGLFANRSFGLSSNVASISSSMREIQNRDPNEGLISAINGLSGPTNNNVYNVNGITYDDGSNIADAVGQLINAAMIERRM